MTTTKFKFTKFGIATNPIGAQITWNVGERRNLADVVDFYRDEVRCVVMLRTRHFNGEAGPDVAASAVDVLVRR